jgi:hypothetical protein
MASNPNSYTEPKRSEPRGSKKVAKRVADAAKAASKEAKRRADGASQATVEALDSNPFGALAGAIAVGAVAAALIPATRREIEALGPLADRLRGLAEDAFHAARDAGTMELTAAGLSLAAASDGLGGVVGKIVKAATAATSAAATSVRQERKTEATPFDSQIDEDEVTAAGAV